ncbi:hypothetical protein E2C01_057490 [Portunus trituberculatus]|uniref:Uncharacterized protein n=1 Tax=Portunus trituberculatus TaxID=210409 RepID=A0A5B7GWY3_PORTR|nr:hypothetical protein [Portunus trituberculatus]
MVRLPSGRSADCVKRGSGRREGAMGRDRRGSRKGKVCVALRKLMWRIKIVKTVAINLLASTDLS